MEELSIDVQDGYLIFDGKKVCKVEDFYDWVDELEEFIVSKTGEDDGS